MAQIFPFDNINDVNCYGHSLNCIKGAFKYKMANIFNTKITLASLRRLWRVLWLLKGLKFTLNRKRERSPNASCIPKVLLIFGRIKERRCDFRLVKVGISWKFEIILFHELVASGKKLFLYLEVLHLSSWKVLELLNLYNGLRCGGSLSLRWEGFLYFSILYLENAPARTTVRKFLPSQFFVTFGVICTLPCTSNS